MYYTNEIQEIVNLRQELSEKTYEFWIDHALFSFNWWLLVFLTIFPWILWWKLVDKSRLFELLTFGLLVAIVVTCLDTVGINLGLWIYKVDLLFFYQHLITMDFSVIPVGYMLVYQYFSRWKSYLLVSLLGSLVGTYIVEPVFVILEIYAHINWEYTYSLPIYFGIGIISKFIVDKIKTLV